VIRGPCWNFRTSVIAPGHPGGAGKRDDADCLYNACRFRLRLILAIRWISHRPRLGKTIAGGNAPVSVHRLLTRLLGAVLTLFITWTVVFGAMRLAPGDPVLLMLQGTPISDQAMDAARAKLGLDRSFLAQYGSFLVNAARGDFGDSFRSHQSVTMLIAAEFPYTLQLAIGGFLIGVVSGSTLGIIAGVWPNGWIDTISMTLALTGLSLPSFWIGMILIEVFATQLGWVPVLGTGLDALILPSISLGLFLAGGLARLVRNSIIEVMAQDYIRTAYAKGLSAVRVVGRHALRNAVIPPLTLLGIQFALLIGGAVVTETVFARPGIGRLLVQAVLDKDFPVVQGVVVLTTAAYVLINFLIDIAYGIIDPRVQG
jgi:ABC-type dipeptide/oligopeptide/nickel transport system permease component